MAEYFRDLGYEEKKEAIKRYKLWHSHDFTVLLVEHLEETREKLVREDEDKTDFLSKFQFSFVSIRNRAKRKLLREILKKIKWEI